MDSLFIGALCLELNQVLTGARIDKIHQPFAHDVVLTLRAQGTTHRLLLSASRNAPRAHLLFEMKPTNPEEPPMFCMMLRKRLEGGRIVSVKRMGTERIVSIGIENLNELGDLAPYSLLLEVMGKHSNLLLCEADGQGHPGRIIDSIVHVSPDVSRVRPVLPGFQYTEVPLQAKVPYDKLVTADLAGLDLVELNDAERAKRLPRAVAGIGPITAREVIHRAKPYSDALLVNSLRTLVDNVDQGLVTATMALDDMGRPVAVAPFNLTYAERTVQAPSLNRALETLFQASVEIRVTSRLARELNKAVAGTLDKLRGKCLKLKSQLEESHQHVTLRIKGELLTTYAADVPRGVNHVELPNYYEDETPIEIALDPARSAIDNAQRYFKMSSKRKRSIPILSAEISATENDMAYLEDVSVHLMDASPDNLKAIQQELVRQGFLKPERAPSAKKPGKKSKHGRPSSMQKDGIPHAADTYWSTDQFAIRVGRNNLQNDRLTLKSSQPNDLWLHVKNQPGSHVVIQCDRREVPETTLHEAAILAAYFSKGRDSANVPVDVAPIRNVWKPNGARPGHVLYEGQKTLFVTPDRSLVQEILTRNTPLS